MTEKTANKISKVRLESIWLIIIDIRPLIDSVKRNHNNLFISLIKLLSFIIIFSYFFCALYQYAEKWLRNIIFWQFFFFFLWRGMQKFNCGSGNDIFSIYPHMKWGKFSGFRSISENDDIPSRAVRELCWQSLKLRKYRYTLTHNEGTPSVAIDFSYLKYIVVQPTQKPFTILVTYLICWKTPGQIIFADFFTPIFSPSKKKKSRRLFLTQNIQATPRNVSLGQRHIQFSYTSLSSHPLRYGCQTARRAAS